MRTNLKLIYFDETMALHLSWSKINSNLQPLSDGVLPKGTITREKCLRNYIGSHWEIKVTHIIHHNYYASQIKQCDKYNNYNNLMFEKIMNRKSDKLWLQSVLCLKIRYMLNNGWTLARKRLPDGAKCQCARSGQSQHDTDRHTWSKCFYIIIIW